MLQYIAIRENDRISWQVLAQVPDIAPVRNTSIVPLLLAPAAVDADNAGPGGQNHLCVFQRLFFRLEDAELGGDRYG